MIHLKRTIIILLLLLQCSYAFSQSSEDSLINALLRDLASMQVSADGEFYSGMFPSYRDCGGAPHNYQPDNNIFFTAIAAFSLRNMLPSLNEENRKLAESIIQKIQSVYPYYKNQYGNPYYGFWPTHSKIMPHTLIFQYLKSVFGQGEDADDSIMILMTDSSNDSTAAILKKQLDAAANLSTPGRRIKSTYKKYRSYPAYSTYLGNRMPPDFDFAVQCNILYFIFDKKLPQTKQDTATINLLADMVANRKYMDAPTYLSPYYVTSPILLYHLCRLMGAYKIPELEKYKTQIIADIKTELSSTNNVMDKIILCTSLMRLGEQAPYIELTSLKDFEESNQKSFVFFQARAAFSYPTPFKQIGLHWSYIYYRFYCPAYNKILWLEYLVNRQYSALSY